VAAELAVGCGAGELATGAAGADPVGVTRPGDAGVGVDRVVGLGAGIRRAWRAWVGCGERVAAI
jgi:hypothetical protein